MDKNFGGVIWTDHALKRLYDRGIDQGDAWVTWKRPDNSRFAKIKGAWVYYKTFNNKRIEIVSTKNKDGKWVILSVWSRTVQTRTKKHNLRLLTLVRKVFNFK